MVQIQEADHHPSFHLKQTNKLAHYWISAAVYKFSCFGVRCDLCQVQHSTKQKITD